MTTNTAQNTVIVPEIDLTQVKGPLNKLIARIQMMRQNARTRRQLADLPPHLLNDIGISEGMRVQELDKPFWR